jgi:hypothetical protein
MKGFLRRRGPTAIAVALAFVAGGATVTTAQNLITSADIKDGAVKTADLGKGAVKSPKIADGQVKRADIAGGAVNSPKIADGQVKAADLAGGAVNSAKIANGGVANADLANNAVNSAKIADSQVKSADLANGGVANADLAANAVNSAKLADNTLTAADLANNAVNTAELANNAVTSAKVADGSLTLADISDAAEDGLTAYSGARWGVVHRNVIGNGDAYLGAGPGFVQVGEPPDVEVVVTPAPFGVGSLGFRTGSATDKAAFGNALDFLGDPVAGLSAVSFHTFTTGENIDISPINLPTISIEILANLAPGLGDYTTMVYEPPAQLPGWQFHDAVAEVDPHWRLTGAEGDETGCNQVTLCTFEDLLNALDDGGTQALIGTVTIAKGSDFAFSGAVDGLRINDIVYDFEPNGVFETPAGP